MPGQVQFYLKCSKNCLVAGLCPDPLRYLYSAPPDPCLDLRGRGRVVGRLGKKGSGRGGTRARGKGRRCAPLETEVWLGHCTVLLISDGLYEAVISQVRLVYLMRL